MLMVGLDNTYVITYLRPQEPLENEQSFRHHSSLLLISHLTDGKSSQVSAIIMGP